jgi:hypothetical protein
MKTFANLSLLLLVSVGPVSAQTLSPYSIGINAGVFIYTGDLAPSRLGSWKTPSFVWGITGHKNLSPELSARVEINSGSLRADETKYGPEYRQYRAFAFSSRVTEAIIAAEYNFLGRNSHFSPYAFAGIGYSNMKIARDYSRFNADYFADEPEVAASLTKDLERLPKGVVVLPVGLGIMYRINEKFSLHPEVAHRITRSDYIDGFSLSADQKQKDGYTKYSIGLRYHLGAQNTNGCPANVY